LIVISIRTLPSLITSGRASTLSGTSPMPATLALDRICPNDPSATVIDTIFLIGAAGPPSSEIVRSICTLIDCPCRRGGTA
jgi:hypothetical protein